MRVDKIGGTILKVLQTDKIYYQSIRVTSCLAMILFECESILKEPCR